MKKDYLEKYKLCINEGDLDQAPLYFDYILHDETQENSENEDIAIFKELIPLYYKYIDMRTEWHGGYNPDIFFHYEQLIKIYIRAEAYDEAVKYLSEEMFDEEIEAYGCASYDIVSVYKYIPCFYHMLGQKEKEIDSSKKLYNMLVEMLLKYSDGDMDDMGYIGEVYFEMGKILKALNEYEKAIEYFESTIQYFEMDEVYDKYIVATYDTIIELYELLENDEMIKLYKEKRINL